jgi:hypothetical protein
VSSGSRVRSRRSRVSIEVIYTYLYARYIRRRRAPRRTPHQRALKVAKRKLGTHKRAKKKREEMAGVLRKIRCVTSMCHFYSLKFHFIQ